MLLSFSNLLVFACGQCTEYVSQHQQHILLSLASIQALLPQNPYWSEVYSQVMSLKASATERQVLSLLPSLPSHLSTPATFNPPPWRLYPLATAWIRQQLAASEPKEKASCIHLITSSATVSKHHCKTEMDFTSSICFVVLREEESLPNFFKLLPFSRVMYFWYADVRDSMCVFLCASFLVICMPQIALTYSILMNPHPPQTRPFLTSYLTIFLHFLHYDIKVNYYFVNWPYMMGCRM